METPKLNFNLQDILNSIVLIACLAVAALLGFFVAWPQYQSYQNSQPLLYEKQLKSDQLTAFVSYLQGLSDFQDQLFANMGLSKQAIPETEEAPFFLDQIIQISNASNVEIDTLTFGGLSSTSSSLPQPSDYNSFGTFQAEDGETIDNSNSTQQVDEFLQFAPTDIANALPTSVPPSEFSVRLEVTGDYASLQSFLRSLENARRLIKISDLNMSRLETANAVNQENSAINEYRAAQAAKGYIVGEDVYTVELIMAGFFMKDPEVAIVGPSILSGQRNLEDIIKELNDLTYYEPQSMAEIELNVGRLNPFDTADIQAPTDNTQDEEDDGLTPAPLSEP